MNTPINATSTHSADELKQVIANLKAAKALITKPENWTQKAFARTINNKLTDSCSADAVCYCAVGTIQKVSNDVYESLEYKLLSSAMVNKELTNNQCYVAEYNDTHTHEEVLAKFDEAIELASVELINTYQ